MAIDPARIWRRWGLLQRIAAVQSLLLIGGAALATVLLIQQQRDALVQDQQARARLLTLVVSPLVAEQAVVGDYAAVKQLLSRQVSVYPDTASLSWRQNGRDEVVVQASPADRSPPEWFRGLVALRPLRHSVPLELGGISYGELEVLLSPATLEAQLWHDSVRSLRMSLAAAGGILLALLIVLRANLRVLKDLASAADRFSNGDHGARIRVEGAREVSHAASAFNNMTQRIQDLVTELSISQNTVREQLHFTEALIEALPVPVYHKNTKGIYTSVNRAWEAFFGLSRHDVIGRQVRELCAHDPETAAFHDDMDQALWREGGVQTYEVTARTLAGVERQAMYSKATLTDADGQICGMIGVITDLTELKAAVQQAQAALVAQAAAEQASQAKSLFLANMSHEIRTPLTAIIGFSDALLDVNQSMHERIEGIRTINRAGKHLLGIINDILDLSKIEAGRLEVEHLPVPLFSLLDEVVGLARLQAEAKGLHFALKPDYPLPETVQSDPVRMRQILLNILGNAIKFTEHGGVTLCVRYDAGQQRLILEVIDTGIGISPEQLARLFQPFSQADASTTRRFGGTGLGLALSKQLAERLGGEISVESRPGEGSRFTISLNAGETGPLVHDDAEAGRLRHRSNDMAQAPELRGTILLAEDNPDNQRLIGLNARRLGAELKVVENGALAVEAALDRPYDLILMDMQMPVMDGMTAVRTLRARGYAGPIVALTANASQQDMQHCLEAGCDGFLTKPIERDRFIETVQRYLSVAPMKEDAGASSTARIPILMQKDPGLTELVRHFLDGAKVRQAELQQALAEGDGEVVKLQARELKSAGANCMCPEISDLAGQIEFAAACGNFAALQQLVARLGSLLASIRLEPTAAAVAPAAEESPLVSTLLDEGPELADLVEYFLTRLPGYEADLRTALADGDLVAIKKKAHDLKSVGGGYGYPLVTDLAIELETHAAGGDLNAVAPLVERFSRLARRIEAGAASLPTARVAAA